MVNGPAPKTFASKAGPSRVVLSPALLRPVQKSRFRGAVGLETVAASEPVGTPAFRYRLKRIAYLAMSPAAQIQYIKSLEFRFDG
jgi:hypothetical protein